MKIPQLAFFKFSKLLADTTHMSSNQSFWGPLNSNVNVALGHGDLTRATATGRFESVATGLERSEVVISCCRQLHLCGLCVGKY